MALPTTADTGIEDLVLELALSGSPAEVVPELVCNGLGIGVLITGVGVSVGCNESVVEGGRDEEAEDDGGWEGLVWV
jgi:hypothetical protein